MNVIQKLSSPVGRVFIAIAGGLLFLVANGPGTFALDNRTRE